MMKDTELKAKLKSVRVPERTDEYWTDFPSRVRVQLPRGRREAGPQSARDPRWVWAFRFATAAALVLVCVQFHPLRTAASVITQREQHIRMQLAQFDTGLHKLMLDQHGMSYLVTEKD
jgi:hypothetical protein